LIEGGDSFSFTEISRSADDHHSVGILRAKEFSSMIFDTVVSFNGNHSFCVPA
jgi:hypothetical protein